MTTTVAEPTRRANEADLALLRAMSNLTRNHRDHEKFYSTAPREQAVVLQRHARTLLALADKWSTAEPAAPSPLSPYEGADDLNAPAAVQLDGVLFLEGEGRPAEISHLIRDLRIVGEDALAAGEWLSTAMRASWDMCSVLLDIDDLAEVLGERHRIIANDWQAAGMSTLAGRVLLRAAEVLEHIDFTPAALRADLTGGRCAPARMYSAAEMIIHAADLCSDSAGVEQDSERRWRVFRRRVAEALNNVVRAGGPAE